MVAQWSKESIVYQIYPRSFNDSNGDGIGDLPGIIERLDYLDALGVDVVWLNPVYDSPLADNGYDVRDYRAILDEYGDMADWEALRDGLHERDIRLIMDLVVNHTSDEHEWFERSRRREEPYADYYVWRSGEPDEPPNNWESFFGGSAWTYDEERGEWYLHLFDRKQPDLDWRNPRVREEVYDMMTWWLEKGIDGFRMDVINLLSKAEGLPDGVPDHDPTGWEHFVNGPNIHEYLREMHDRVLSRYDVMTVGETPGVSPEDARRYVNEDGLDMVFHFSHMYIDQVAKYPFDVGEWELTDLKSITATWQRSLVDAWTSVFLGNHDQPRMVSRFGDEGQYRAESAKMLATFLLTHRGTPYIYQGDEIGMVNPTFDRLDEYRDVETIRLVELAFETGDIDLFEEVKDVVNYWSRDNSRTPMQWSAGKNAGFTDGEPWIKVNANYPSVNVERAREDDESVWHYYRRLIELRHERSVLVYGDYELLLPEHPEVYAYLRRLDGERLLVVLNFFGGEPAFALPDRVGYEDAEPLIGNYEVDRVADTALDGMDLRPYEARVYQLW